MRRLRLLAAIPISRLSSFRYWPFDEVCGIRCTYLSGTAGGTTYPEYCGRNLTTSELGDRILPDTRHVPVSNAFWRLAYPVRKRRKGSGTRRVPISFQIDIPEEWGPIYLFRHWDWCWVMNWMMRDSLWQAFLPEPYLLQAPVDELIRSAKELGIYVPLEGERNFPASWLRHAPTIKGPFLGHGDQRYYGDFIWDGTEASLLSERKHVID